VSGPAEVLILDAGTGPLLPIVDGAGSARAVVWPGMGARHRSLHRLTLDEGARTVELSHPAEAVYYLVAGTASALDRSSGERHELEAGAMIHVEPGTPYVLAAGDAGAELVGGPCPPDPDLYEGLGES
jgi:quercetin dioxygenase-like cupin family protein